MRPTYHNVEVRFTRIGWRKEWCIEDDLVERGNDECVIRRRLEGGRGLRYASKLSISCFGYNFPWK